MLAKPVSVISERELTVSVRLSSVVCLSVCRL